MVKVVKIIPSRGYGDGMFLVVRTDHNQYVLKPISGGEQFMLYTAHTYEDIETKRKGAELTRARSESIGRNKR